MNEALFHCKDAIHECEEILSLENQLDGAQEKLQEMKRLTYDLHRRSGHPDSACLRCQLYDILND